MGFTGEQMLGFLTLIYEFIYCREANLERARRGQSPEERATETEESKYVQQQNRQDRRRELCSRLVPRFVAGVGGLPQCQQREGMLHQTCSGGHGGGI